MIQVLIDAMDQAAAVVSVSTRNGLCELRPSASGGRMPVKSAGGGEFVPVAEDVRGTLSYWRLLSDVVSERADVVEACEGLRYTMRLRLVMMVDRSGPCEDITSALTSVANNVRGNTRAFRTALRAASVTINSTTFVVNGVALSEFGSERVLPTGRDIVAVDFAVSVLGTSGCLLGCTDAEEFTVVFPATPCPPIRLCTDDLEMNDIPVWNGSQWVPGTASAGSGDVVGPASAANNNFAAFNLTTGKIIKDSGSNATSFDAAGAASAAQAAAIAAASSDATTKANAAQAAAISAAATDATTKANAAQSAAIAAAAADATTKANAAQSAAISAASTDATTKANAAQAAAIASAATLYAPLAAPALLTYSGGSQVNATTTFANIHSSAAWAVGSTGLYEFVANINYDVNATSNGAKFSVNSSDVTFSFLAITCDYTSGGASRSSSRSSGYNTGLAGNASAVATGNGATLRGTIMVTATGTLSLSFGALTAVANAVTVTAVTGYIRKLN